MLWWDGTQWKDGNAIPPPAENWFIHFLLFAVVMIVLYLAMAFLVGVAALPFALRATGRRARDFLMFLIPFWGRSYSCKTVWRLSARRMCWLPRHDLPSKPLFGPAILPKDVIPPPGPTGHGTVESGRRMTPECKALS